jgi:hypothetical protein
MENDRITSVREYCCNCGQVQELIGVCGCCCWIWRCSACHHFVDIDHDDEDDESNPSGDESSFFDCHEIDPANWPVDNKNPGSCHSHGNPSGDEEGEG